ncbi:MAG TPA: hypothetical protein VGL53_16185 [Bryobacteraceae bacterium]|jgi:hypothetical protein
MDRRGQRELILEGPCRARCLFVAAPFDSIVAPFKVTKLRDDMESCKFGEMTEQGVSALNELFPIVHNQAVPHELLLKLQRECYWTFYGRPPRAIFLLTRKFTHLRNVKKLARHSATSFTVAGHCELIREGPCRARCLFVAAPFDSVFVPIVAPFKGTKLRDDMQSRKFGEMTAQGVAALNQLFLIGLPHDLLLKLQCECCWKFYRRPRAIFRLTRKHLRNVKQLARAVTRRGMTAAKSA